MAERSSFLLPDPEDENQFAEQFYVCCLNDVSVRMFTNVSSLVNGAVKSLVSLTYTFVEAYEKKFFSSDDPQ